MPLRGPDSNSSRYIWLASAVVIATLLLTLDRIPVSRGDGPFYASIGRSFHYDTGGVPSTLDPRAPTAIDHIRFYGPVYFRILDLSFAVFGFSLTAFRSVGIVGVLLVALGGVLICMALGGGPERRAWTWLLVLLTPEVGRASSNGRMDALAVGLELCGLAIFLDGLVKQRRPWLHGTAAGLLLAAAALTTPRTFPFLAAFLFASVVILPRGLGTTKIIRLQAGVTLGTGALIGFVWMMVSSGGPVNWLHLMTAVGTQENTDVALLPNGARHLMFVWWECVTPAFAIAGALVAARLLRHRPPSAYTLASAFALLTTWTTLVLTTTLFNLTFFFGTYFVLPLVTVVIAVPTPLSDIRRRGAAFTAVTLFLLLVGVRAGKMVLSAITWDGRDLNRVERFVADHVPPGSRVLGPGHDYFFPVEEAGSRYLAVPQISASDWARWVAQPGPPPGARLVGTYLLWREGDPPPPASVGCASGRLVATYEPPPPTLPPLAFLVQGDSYAQYPRMFLYTLDRTCPASVIMGGSFPSD